jgi:hypothetical protein
MSLAFRRRRGSLGITDHKRQGDPESTENAGYAALIRSRLHVAARTAGDVAPTLVLVWSSKCASRALLLLPLVVSAQCRRGSITLA